MATKTLLYELPRVNDAIEKAFKLKRYDHARADVEVYGPDDRRSDDLIGKDASLKKDLATLCEKAVAKYRDEIGKFLSDQEKAAEKAKGAARATLVSEFIGAWVSFRRAAFGKLETAVSTEAKKRWAKAAAGDGALKGVRFDAIVMPIDLEFYLEFEAEAAPEKEPERVGGRVKLADAQKPMSDVEKDVTQTVEFMKEIPGRTKQTNAILAALQKDYDAGPRESQKDDPVTEGDEEPDEAALDASLFAKHGKNLVEAWGHGGMIDVYLVRAVTGAEAGLKSLPRAIKLIVAASNEGNPEAPGNKKLAEKAASLNECVRLLAMVESEGKVARGVLAESYSALAALKDRKSAALGLIAKARIDLKAPTDKLASALKLLQESAVA